MWGPWGWRCPAVQLRVRTTWCEASMWFPCVCSAGEEGDKEAIVPRPQLEPSFPLTSRRP